MTFQEKILLPFMGVWALLAVMNAQVMWRWRRRRPGERVPSAVPVVGPILLSIGLSIAAALPQELRSQDGSPFGLPFWAWLLGAWMLDLASGPLLMAALFRWMRERRR